MSQLKQCIMKTCPFNYMEIFSEEKKKRKFHLKNFDFLNTFTQNMHCWCMLELPHRDKEVLTSTTMNVLYQNNKIRYIPVNTSFSYIKVGFKGVYISQTCFPDAYRFLNGPRRG